MLEYQHKAINAQDIFGAQLTNPFELLNSDFTRSFHFQSISQYAGGQVVETGKEQEADEKHIP